MGPDHSDGARMIAAHGKDRTATPPPNGTRLCGDESRRLEYLATR
jgi:hypothetical protein